MLVLAGLLRWRLPRYREDVRLTYPRLLASTLGIARAQPVLRLRALYGALAFANFAVVWASLAFLLAGPRYGYSEGTIGLFGLMGAAGAAMAIVAGRLADRGWSRGVTGASSLIMVFSYLLVWLGGAGRVWPLIAGIVLVEVGSNGLHITNQSEIYRLDPEARSRINAVYMTSCFIGAAVGSATSAVRLRPLGLDRRLVARGGVRPGLHPPVDRHHEAGARRRRRPSAGLQRAETARRAECPPRRRATPGDRAPRPHEPAPRALLRAAAQLPFWLSASTSMSLLRRHTDQSVCDFSTMGNPRRERHGGE